MKWKWKYLFALPLFIINVIGAIFYYVAKILMALGFLMMGYTHSAKKTITEFWAIKYSVKDYKKWLRRR